VNANIKTAIAGVLADAGLDAETRERLESELGAALGKVDPFALEPLELASWDFSGLAEPDICLCCGRPLPERKAYYGDQNE